MTRRFRSRWFSLAFLSVICFSSTAFAVDISTATGQRIHYDAQEGIAVVEGNAVVETSTATIKADKISVNPKSKEGHATGHVEIFQSSQILIGNEGQYNWGTSTGVLTQAYGENPPYRFAASTMTQISPNVLILNRGGFTSCDLDPPHYVILSSKSKIRLHRRATLRNARFTMDDTPILYSPIYTHSLVPHKYSLRIEPGHSGRDGYMALTTFGYPITPHTYTKFKWDWRQRTGNGAGLDHRYFIDDKMDGLFYWDYFRDINPDPYPQSRRYKIQWGHYQKLTPRLTTRARFDFQSDTTYANDFQRSLNQGIVQNNRRPMESRAEFNYQFPKASLNAQVERKDLYDTTISSHFFISQVTLPRLAFVTSPLIFKYFPFYVNLSANYLIQTEVRTDPDQSLHYFRSGDSSLSLSREYKVPFLGTLTPRLGYSESWLDRDISKDISKDTFQGTYTAGLDDRRKLGRNLNMLLGYDYQARLEKNRMNLETKADDRGIVTNQLRGSFQSSIGRSTRLTLSSGYDLRHPPRSDPERYRFKNERITSPTLDVQWQASPQVNVYFRETYAVYDPQQRRIVRSPINTSGEIQINDASQTAYFSQGFSYTKRPPTAQALSSVILNNRIKFYLTRNWYLDYNLSYQILGEYRLHFKRVQPIAHTLAVIRDLHCWILRMQFVGRRVGSATQVEASFNIDLKTNIASQGTPFNRVTNNPFYPYTEAADVTDVFKPGETIKPILPNIGK
ncbi:MAG: hypothetical protein LHV69_00940 [Elusimicrobia bacterium]|nr:hypothetical protein [Candidatus Obscuribacterium magneticum]